MIHDAGHDVHNAVMRVRAKYPFYFVCTGLVMRERDGDGKGNRRGEYEVVQQITRQHWMWRIHDIVSLISTYIVTKIPVPIQLSRGWAERVRRRRWGQESKDEG